jgi:nicotinate-nucleotide--dimethylbenzimidazole phosphoribosyltransferase
MNIAAASKLIEIAASIPIPEPRYYEQAQAHLDSLTKPPGSLGRLETIAAQMVAIRSGSIRLPLRKGVCVFAADHGIASEGVSAYPREVTAQMVLNFLRGGAAINVLARLHGADLTVVDVGVDAEFEEASTLHRAKVRNGSRNFLREAAMSDDELSAALDVGFAMARNAEEKGHSLVAVGEMGIGNTTSASAITAMLTGLQLAEVTGRGTGLDDSGRDNKRSVIERALALHFHDSRDIHPLEILRCVGGLEIAAMVGFYLGAAQRCVAIICDGFISTSAAALAYAIAPQVKSYLLAGHCSEEPGHRHLLHYLGLSAILSLGMRLGEGTGAVLAMPIVESSLRIYNEMATFSSAGVSGAKS